MQEKTSSTGQLHCLCYVSKSLEEFTSNELVDLVRFASQFNHENNITGFLCYHQDRFFQYLEGPEKEVKNLLTTITNDSRHTLINTISLDDITERRYTRWSMMQVKPSARGISSLLETLFQILIDGNKETPISASTKTTLCALLDCLGEDPMRENIEADFIGTRIIAIGASAGGIAPIKTLLTSLPKDIDASILLVLHLSPSHKTVLDEILERDTGFPVHLAKDNELLLPGKVYLIPPSKNLQVISGRLRVTEQAQTEFRLTDENHMGENHIPFPIDILFTSIARQYGRRVVGIVLSGSGNDGTRGAKVLQEAGAIVIAQTPVSSEFDSMPQAVISANAANRVLEPTDIAKFVVNIVNSHTHMATFPLTETDSNITEQILTLLANYGVDFTGYKRQTLFNRLQRRRALVEAKTLEEYHGLLTSSEDERLALKNDLLICVTDFFRDFAAWNSLRKLIRTRILSSLVNEETIRVWVPGCATGEEAYSVAIMLLEILDEENIDLDFKIFATDLSEDSLRLATDGVYKSASLKIFTEKQRQKYFHQNNDSYQISTSIRERVITTKHNLVQDAPFTNMHLVCCRNVIIYMEPDLQKHVLKILHFALVRDGMLFLGPSESIGPISNEFETVDREWNLHTKKREKKIPLHLDSPSFQRKSVTPRVRGVEFTSREKGDSKRIYQKSIEALCRSEGKTALILDEKKTVELVVSDPNGLLQVASGQPGATIDKLIVSSLVPAVIVNLQQLTVLDESQLSSQNIACVNNHDDELHIDLEIIQILKETGDQHWLLTFAPSKAPVTQKIDTANKPGETTATGWHQSQQDELESTKKKLAETQRVLFETVQELEVSNVEQNDAFEQLTAANEELQSTNEELQSVNEELYTVNFEYQSKIHELSDLTNDMNNLMRCTDLGVIFIDTEMCIRRYTDQAAKITRLVPSDVDRPIENISRQLNYPKLSDDISRVLSLGKSIVSDLTYENCPNRLHVGIYPYKVDSELAQGAILMMLDLAQLRTFAVDTNTDRTPMTLEAID